MIQIILTSQANGVTTVQVYDTNERIIFTSVVMSEPWVRTEIIDAIERRLIDFNKT